MLVPAKLFSLLISANADAVRLRIHPWLRSSLYIWGNSLGAADLGGDEEDQWAIGRGDARVFRVNHCSNQIFKSEFLVCIKVSSGLLPLLEGAMP